MNKEVTTKRDEKTGVNARGLLCERNERYT